MISLQLKFVRIKKLKRIISTFLYQTTKYFPVIYHYSANSKTSFTHNQNLAVSATEQNILALVADKA
jgi:hypothetical protein